MCRRRPSPPGSPSEAWQALWRAGWCSRSAAAAAPGELRARPGGPAALLVRGDPRLRLRRRGGAVAGAGAACPVRCRCWTCFSLWRDEARSPFWLSAAGVRVLSDRAERGGSASGCPGPTPRNRLPPGLVPAPAEELPPAP